MTRLQAGQTVTLERDQQHAVTPAPAQAERESRRRAGRRVMVIGGLVLRLTPGIPDITLNPDLIFLVVLPPLLYAAAWTTSWRDFRWNIVSVFLLAFGLAVLYLMVAKPDPRRVGDRHGSRCRADSRDERAQATGPIHTG